MIRHNHSRSAARRRAARAGIVTLAATAMFISGCASGNTNNQGDSAKDIEKGAAAELLPAKYEAGIKAGMLCGAGKISFCDPGSTVGQGVLADVAHAWGAKLDTKVDVQGMAWEALMPAAVSGRTDLIVGIGDMPDRHDKFTFVDIFTSGLAVLVPKDNPKNIETNSDLCGLKLSAAIGSGEADEMTKISDQCVKDGNPAINIELFTEQPATFVAVQSNRVDGTFTDASAAIQLLEDNPDLYMRAFTIEGTTTWGIAIPKDNENLIKAVAVAVKELIDDGEIAKIIKKWGMDSALKSMDEPMINTEPRDLSTK